MDFRWTWCVIRTDEHFLSTGRNQAATKQNSPNDTFYSFVSFDASLAAQSTSTLIIWLLSSQQCVGDQRCLCGAGSPGPELFSG